MPPFFRRDQTSLLITAVICTIFLFVGGPDLIHTRSFKQAWDLGHIAAFTVWSLLLVRSWPRLASVPFRSQVITVLLFCLVAGGSVEIIQRAFGRYASLGDIGLNAVGSLLALFFFFPDRRTIEKRLLRLLQILTCVLFLIAMVPLSRAVVDEWTAWRQFPVLADFETAFELDRWSGNAELTIDDTIAQSGRASLKMGLTTEKYSGAELEYFPGNWRNYHAVAFSIYNPDKRPVKIVCKIRDHHHDISGYRYNDRFNRSYSIPHGWNRIEIAMADIETAPLNRRMDLARVTGIQVFTVSLPERRTLFLDHLLLKP